MSAANKHLDKRAVAAESLLRPAIKLVPVDRQHPRILYVTSTLRVVLRPLDRYPEGYVEIERRSENAMNVETWLYVESFSLNLREYEQHWKDAQTPLMVLVHFLRTLVPELRT